MENNFVAYIKALAIPMLSHMLHFFGHLFFQINHLRNLYNWWLQPLSNRVRAFMNLVA